MQHRSSALVAATRDGRIHIEWQRQEDFVGDCVPEITRPEGLATWSKIADPEEE